ncbi:uncharacterized protein BP5553_03461 [Venustampulla echinocandica]|uniref:Uncharacterized protein n=1 Tax=Venustampulla echinocandica TaxID=2656787 RepID=A0A370TUB6_9HELO|nr:uncharacterized protein BP5553_03461 [Venustampulla echinocandica]RDL39121.1 hypothetical protein BP5553_03461 [Venustampulla echinocandica]
MASNMTSAAPDTASATASASASSSSSPLEVPAIILTPPTPPPTPRPARGRARSRAISSANPLLEPVTPEEESVAYLARVINSEREREAALFLLNPGSPEVQRGVSPEREAFERAQQRSGVFQPGGYRGTSLTSHRRFRSDTEGNPHHNQTDLLRFPAPTDPQSTAQYTRASALRYLAGQPGIGRSSPQNLVLTGTDTDTTPSTPTEPQYPSPTHPNPRALLVDVPDFPTDVFEDQHSPPRVAATINRPRRMNSQNYIDTPQGGSNPRQAPPSPSQGMAHTNGMNGGMSAGNGLVGYPTPAGHQSDLNYVMSMVEELSGILRINQQLTASVVDKMGKVREKAKNTNLSNDELIQAVADEMNEDSENLEKDNSELRKALEKSENNKKENWKLAVHGAEILADIAEKMHRFKEQHEADTLAWHKNYRKQLADEREENLNLRNQINDMKAAACRANESLRQMRRYVTDNDKWHEMKVENHHLRTEKRFWKRLALPLIPDDDSEWSDDDDLIDPEEKQREIAKKEKERKDKEDGGSGEDGDQVS